MPTTEEHPVEGHGPDTGGIFAKRAAAEMEMLSGKVVTISPDLGLRIEILKLAAEHDQLGTPTSTVNAAETYWKWMNE